MNEMMPKEMLRSEKQIDYYADVCGRMTAMAVMQDLGNIPFVQNVGTPYDIRFFELCGLLAEEKYQTFLDTINLSNCVATDTLQTTAEVLHRTGLGFHAVEDNRQNENAIEYLQGVRPNTVIGARIVGICNDVFIQHYKDIARNNLAQALEQSDHSSSSGLGIPLQIGKIASNAQFYAGYYYQYPTSV